MDIDCFEICSSLIQDDFAEIFNPSRKKTESSFGDEFSIFFQWLISSGAEIETKTELESI